MIRSRCVSIDANKIDTYADQYNTCFYNPSQRVIVKPMGQSTNGQKKEKRKEVPLK